MMKVIKIVGIVFLSIFLLGILSTFIGQKDEPITQTVESARQSVPTTPNNAQPVEIRTLKELKKYYDAYTEWMKKQTKIINTDGSFNFDQVVEDWIAHIRPFDSARKNFPTLLKEFNELSRRDQEIYYYVFYEDYSGYGDKALDAFENWITLEKSPDFSWISFLVAMEYNSKSSMLPEYRKRIVERFRQEYPDLGYLFYSSLEHGLGAVN